MADIVIDYLAADWGIEVQPEQRKIENKLMGADEDGKIVFTKVSTKPITSPSKHGVYSYGMNVNNSEETLGAAE